MYNTMILQENFKAVLEVEEKEQENTQVDGD
jgi:hypothetical protein